MINTTNNRDVGKSEDAKVEKLGKSGRKVFYTHWNAFKYASLNCLMNSKKEHTNTFGITRQD